jgi:chromate transporter
MLILSMYKSFCKTKLTIWIALISALFLVLFSSILSTILALIFFAIIGVIFIKSQKTDENLVPYKKINYIYLLLFIGIFFGLMIFGVYGEIFRVYQCFL